MFAGNSDEGGHSAGIRTVGAVRVENRRVSLSAETRTINPGVLKASLDELIAIDRRQVQPERPGLGTRKPPRKLVVRGTALAKGVEQFGADFVTARADAGPDRRDEIGRPHAEFFYQRLNAGRRDARRGSAPSRVNGRHGTASRIAKQHGHAVGNLDREHVAGSAGDHRVRVRRDLVEWTRARPDYVDGSPMNLFYPFQISDGAAHGLDRLDPGLALPLERTQLQLLRGEQMLRHLTKRLATQRVAPSLTAPVKCGIWRRKRHAKAQDGGGNLSCRRRDRIVINPALGVGSGWHQP